jgi:hypothetical protein
VTHPWSTVVITFIFPHSEAVVPAAPGTGTVVLVTTFALQVDVEGGLEVGDRVNAHRTTLQRGLLFDLRKSVF